MALDHSILGLENKSGPAGTKRRSQVTGQVTGHRAQVTGYRAQGTGHRAQKTQ